MMLYALILVAVLFTSMLSGVLGMAGGMILMAILVAVLPVATAMMLHGAVQAFSNGSRAWFLRRHVRWDILPWYAVGAAAAVTAFTLLTVVPEPALVLVLIGLMPWIARLTPRLGSHLDVSRPVTAVVCGVVVTIAQLLAGASGPLLDLFYLNGPLDRYQVVANKALTQTLGHLLKLVYYGTVVAAVDGLPVWLYAAGMLVAVAGARIGTGMLDKVADDGFRRVSGWVILAIGAGCVVQGVWQLLVG